MYKKKLEVYNCTMKQSKKISNLDNRAQADENLAVFETSKKLPENL